MGGCALASDQSVAQLAAAAGDLRRAVPTRKMGGFPEQVREAVEGGALLGPPGGRAGEGVRVQRECGVEGPAASEVGRGREQSGGEQKGEGSVTGSWGQERAMLGLGFTPWPNPLIHGARRGWREVARGGRVRLSVSVTGLWWH